MFELKDKSRLYSNNFETWINILFKGYKSVFVVYPPGENNYKDLQSYTTNETTFSNETNEKFLLDVADRNILKISVEFNEIYEYFMDPDLNLNIETIRMGLL